MSVVRPEDPLFRWPFGMALEIGICLCVLVVSSVAALAAWLIF